MILLFLLVLSLPPPQVGPGDVGSEASIDTVAAVPLPFVRFDDARAIEADPFGALYVADAGRHVVVKLDTTGLLVERIGGPGSREGSFDRPMDVDPTNGLVLLIADAGNGRIQLFSRSHAFLGFIPLTRGRDGDDSRITYRRRDVDPRNASTGMPIAVASFGSNEIAAVDADRNVVLRWNENRSLTAVIGDVDAGSGVLGEPVSLWADTESQLYVADRGRRAVLVYDQFGSHTHTIGAGRLTRLVAVAGHQDEVYAVTTQAIHVFDRRGRFLRELRPMISEALVDVTAIGNGALFAVTSNRAYRVFR